MVPSELKSLRRDHLFTLRISQEDLAAFLGVSRQAVNQQLQAWKARGRVELGRGSMTVLDERVLHAPAQGG